SWYVEQGEKGVQLPKLSHRRCIVGHLLEEHMHLGCIEVTSHPSCLMNCPWFQEVYTTRRRLTQDDQCIFSRFTIVISWKSLHRRSCQKCQKLFDYQFLAPGQPGIINL